MDIESDLSYIASSYHLDEFDYEEFADNERARIINGRWGVFDEVNERHPKSVNGIIETKEP
ncbi:hypothetical protein [Photobacterium sp. OFAV2-7]|uniref:hypothetical protein n=1 Tax=Photobacterium sp. OFAV2-7 TaxID=2917748 RepID=UPI001EF53D57|nr:hypothetical protein [Photobacterium sp. OFAV2-7]MCG7586663.1 hypothetical protein [Photobacterium sp. OFAV2-7]